MSGKYNQLGSKPCYFPLASVVPPYSSPTDIPAENKASIGPTAPGTMKTSNTVEERKLWRPFHQQIYPFLSPYMKDMDGERCCGQPCGKPFPDKTR
eukprot:scaffold21_cov107-Cylindrotheca_fusiformis.AAC.2